MTARKNIWQRHLYGDGIKIPFDESINIDELAEKYDSFCGREIKNAVIYACTSEAVKVRRDKLPREKLKISHEHLINASEKVKTEAQKVLRASDHTVSHKLELSEETSKEVSSIMQQELDKKKQKNNSPDSL